jgi:BRCT domain type II-containing protein
LTNDEESMATTSATKAAAKPAPKKAVTPVEKKAKVPTVKKAATPATKKAVAATPLKPIKDSFTKASLAIHLAERAGVEPKAAKALMAALEETVLASVHKKGAKEFTLPGLLKVIGPGRAGKEETLRQGPVHGRGKVVCGEARVGASESTPAEKAEGRRTLIRTAGMGAPRDGSLRGFFASMPVHMQQKPLRDVKLIASQTD